MAYRLDDKSKYRFCSSMFFDFMDVTHVSSHILCMKLGDDISLLNFKFVVAKDLIGRYSNRNGSFCTSRLSKLKFHEPSMTIEVPTRMPEFQ